MHLIDSTVLFLLVPYVLAYYLLVSTHCRCDRLLFGFWSLFLGPRRIQWAAVIIRPSTLLKFHDLLKKRKYLLLYSSNKKKEKPGPKGPSPELIQAIVELKQRNPRFGYLRIAQQIAKAFGVDIDKDLI